MEDVVELLHRRPKFLSDSNSKSKICGLCRLECCRKMKMRGAGRTTQEGKRGRGHTVEMDEGRMARAETEGEKLRCL